MSFSSSPSLVVNQLSDTEYPDNFEGFIEVFSRENKKVIDVVNSKESALYVLKEVGTFKQFFIPNDPLNNRFAFRRTVNFGSLPDTATKRILHGTPLPSSSRLTMLYGSATCISTGEFFPLPFSSPTLANNVSLEANRNEIIITTGADLTRFTDVLVVFEFTKE